MTASWELMDHRAVRVEASLRRVGYKVPLSIVDMRITPKVTCNTQGVVVIHIRYRFGVRDAKQSLIISFDVENALVFRTTLEGGRYNPTHAEITAYLPRVLEIAHSYLREKLHWLTMWMGLPPLVIDMYKAPPTVAPANPEPPKTAAPPEAPGAAEAA